MRQEDQKRYEELSMRDDLSEREFAEYIFLKGVAESTDTVSTFLENQKAPYNQKLSRAYNLAWEFFHKVEGQAYVAVGGLDSIVLYVFLRSIGINVPAVSVSGLEDKSIQRVHKALGVQRLKSQKSKVQVIREFGWPVISKEVANKISLLQNPTEKNKTVRHAIITGETGAYGGYRKGTRMRLAQCWLDKFGGYENETEGTNYGKPDFLVSDKCCYYLKEKPCNDYAKESGRWPYMGLMASEGGRRQKTLMINGCNYISPTTKRSCPFATFMRQDILTLALEMNEWYLTHQELFDGEPIESIIPTIYGTIQANEDGNLRTTRAQRTGCSMCAFGLHKEKRPHRFDRLYQDNPKEWEFWMFNVVQRNDGSKYGWGHIFDYIGIEWRHPELFVEQEQLRLF